MTSERDLDTDLRAASQAPEFMYVLFAALNFTAGVVRVHNGVGTLSFGGNTYLGVGTFGSIEPIQESINLVDTPVKIQLSSINQEIIDAVKDESIYGRAADLYLGTIDRANKLQGTPTNWISGYMDFPTTKQGLNEDSVTINILTRAAKLKRRNGKRYTLEQHQVDYPEDRFFEFLPYVKEANVPWGGEQVRTGFRSDDGLISGRNQGNGVPGGGFFPLFPFGRR